MVQEPQLLIGDMPGISIDFHTALTNSKYLRLRHRLRYWGGHWELAFFLSDADHGASTIDNYFNSWLMNQIGEYYGGVFTWRGVVWEMARIKDGKRQKRTMSDVYNAVKCIYTTTTSTEQVETAWVTDDNSIARYLRKEQIVYHDGISSTQATAEANKLLMTSYDAWPKTTSFDAYGDEGLEVTCVGMGRLFNNLFCTATTPTSMIDVDDFVTAIWTTDLDPFLTFLSLGGIDTNDYEVQRELRAPTRCGDLIDALARGGDNTVPYRWYVTGDLAFRFEKFVNTPILEWRGRKAGGLYKIGGSRVTWDAAPGVLEDVTLPPLPALPGDFLQQRNHELVEQFSMWQGQDAPQPGTEELTEAQLLSDMESYQRMITDGNFDRLHTPGASPGYGGAR